MIETVQSNDVFSYCCSLLKVDTPSLDPNGELMHALVRYSAGILCPCSKSTLAAAIEEQLSGLLTMDYNTMRSATDSCIDNLLMLGDLLELSDVAIDEALAKNTWVFVAPPSFVARKNNCYYILGIVRDHASFLPVSLQRRVTHCNGLRYILGEPKEDLRLTLLESGLHELSEETWLKAPKTLSAAKVIQKFDGLLCRQSHCDPIDELEVLNTTSGVTFYKGRWGPTKRLSGNFVCRRPQEFGAPLWGYTELINGEVQRVLNLPTAQCHWRGCDMGWHIQMARDYLAGKPQTFKVTRIDNTVRLDFFSPLPIWAERRLRMLGERASSNQCLLSYMLPEREANSEIRWLEDNLWVAPI